MFYSNLWKLQLDGTFSGLLVLDFWLWGFIPSLNPDRISAKYGLMVLAVGIVKLMAGFVDYQCSFVNLYSPLFQQFNEIISIVLIAVLLYITVSIIQDSAHLKREKIKMKVKKGI